MILAFSCLAAIDAARVLLLMDPDNVALTETWKLILGEIRVRIDPQLKLEFWEKAKPLDFNKAGGILKVAISFEYREEKHGRLDVVRECIRIVGVPADEVVLGKTAARSP